jgi:HAD superfamily hydrolase (TIGR01509 family)
VSSYEAILFDFDGVLADSEPLHWRCWREVLAPLGLDLSWDYYERECIGVADREMLERLGRLTDPPHALDKLWPLYPLKKEKFRLLVESEKLIPPATIQAIRGLRGYRLAVVTSSMQAEILPILEREGVLSLFQACVYGDSVKRLKPDPEPYLLARSLLGVSRALVLEDSAAGQASGRAAGCDVLAVRNAADVPRLLEGLQAR